MRPVLILCFAVAACGGDDADVSKIDGSVGVDADTRPDATSNAEPCDYTNPKVVTLGETVTSDAPSASCTEGAHFYRFTPAVAGVYSIDKKGEGSLGYCSDESGAGCICGVNINCCSECVLTYSLPGGGDLPAGSNNQIYIDSETANAAYSFTITGPQ